MNLHLQLISLYAAIVAASCYYPNGTEVTDGSFQPCRSTGFTMCCATAQRPADGTDTCLDNGLCYNPCALSDNICNSGSSGTYWRESCTDPTWQSPYCLGRCLSNVTSSYTTQVTNGTNDNVPMTQCPSDEKWCCGYIAATDCCSDPDRFDLAQTIGVATSSSTSATSSITSSATSSASSVTSSTSSALTTSTTSSQPSGSSSSATGSLGLGAKVGMGVGIGIGVSFILAIAAIAWRRAKQKQRNQQQQRTVPSLMATNDEYYSVQKQELDANPKMYPVASQRTPEYSEMAADPHVYELG